MILILNLLRFFNLSIMSTDCSNFYLQEIWELNEISKKDECIWRRIKNIMYGIFCCRWGSLWYGFRKALPKQDTIVSHLEYQCARERCQNYADSLENMWDNEEFKKIHLVEWCINMKPNWTPSLSTLCEETEEVEDEEEIVEEKKVEEKEDEKMEQKEETVREERKEEILQQKQQ